MRKSAKSAPTKLVTCPGRNKGWRTENVPRTDGGDPDQSWCLDCAPTYITGRTK